MLPSPDLTLKSLSLSTGTLVPGFSPSRNAYASTVPAGIDAVSVTAVPTGDGCEITISGRSVKPGNSSAPIRLDIGRSFVEVAVTGPGGAPRTLYTIKLVRAHPTPDWEVVCPAAPWSPRDSAGELVYGGRMWLLGGYTPELRSDVWSSSDGRAWSNVGSVPTEAGINIPVAFVLRDRMWMSDNDGRLFSSNDGVSWELESEKQPWGGRYGAGCAVHHGRAWVMGGLERGGRTFNDVWSSEDGRTWVEESAAAAWSPRQLFGNVVSHAGRLWVVGGGISRYEPFRSYRDVWSSGDGRRWTLATEEAPWPGRIWSSCAVYRDRIWLLGGFRSQPTWNNWNDPWYSEDGSEWRSLESEHIWQPRHETSVYVLDDALWVAGGNVWPLANDVWRLGVRGLSFLTQPVVEEITGLAYRYAARADFHAPPGPVRYRLAQSPAWLTVDHSNGVVRGRAGAPGAYPVSIVAESASGESAVQSYVLHVIA